jgi:CDP-diacylglycerol--serine O-phosphatidyltransferase
MYAHVSFYVGTCSIFFCLNFLENARHLPYLNAAFILLPLALVFDICDGTVARWRKSSSIYGADLDSLADAVSFGVAPAVLGFTLGLRGLWDSIILSFFVCCVIGRLARFNVTAEQLSYGGNKVKYFQGTHKVGIFHCYGTYIFPLAVYI